MNKKFDESSKPEYPSLTINDDCSSPEPATSTSTVITSTAHPIPSIPASAATASVQVIQAAGVAVSI